MKKNYTDLEYSCFYKLLERLEKFNRIYIYGAGSIGNCVFNYLVDNKLIDKLDSFLVTTESINNHKNNRFIFGKRVQLISKVELDSDDVVLLAAVKQNREEMLSICQKYNIKNVIEIDYFDWERNFQISESEYPTELKCWYKLKVSKNLNLDDPKTFNEKIQWLKIYDRNPLKTQLADKYLVRSYIEEKVGKRYLVPLLSVWDKAEDIDFDNLPNQFVLKCNHGSGSNIIVRDKSRLDIDKTKFKLNLWLKKNFAFTNGFELQYKDIKPKVIAEEYLENVEGDLWDYKFWCFDGKVKFLQVDRSRLSNHVQRFYSPDWKPLSFTIQNHIIDEVILDKPASLEEMINVSENLSKIFCFVRVDLYCLNNKIYFGEMTFSPLSGFITWNPEYMDNEVGALLKMN